ncbi:class I SAM-dependent methyltransferase [Castellaniella sp.]|uniref:class I SAM-dependent methyltransferase n=1 Tax=Castellaniella sp. TaxID=1955812 RepID=UPI002AFFD626|nr:class I SAM-dependent methyltransferase [Castellaniella sp.]
MATTHFKDFFSSNSASYAAHRPSYPLSLVQELARLSPALTRALDCGCGTGQLSTLLADRFDEVIASDASATQIEKARPHDRVIYRIALAEDCGLPDASVDLITVAQAAHWLNLEKFYVEAQRVARPQAAIALITYGVLHVDGAVDAAIQHFYHDTIASYWPTERRHVDTGYRNLPFPFKELALPPLAIELQWRLDDLIGYLKTWSAVKAAENALGINPVDELAATLRKSWGGPTVLRKITWPLSVRAGHIQQ